MNLNLIISCLDSWERRLTGMLKISTTRKSLVSLKIEADCSKLKEIFEYFVLIYLTGCGVKISSVHTERKEWNKRFSSLMLAVPLWQELSDGHQDGIQTIIYTTGIASEQY